MGIEFAITILVKQFRENKVSVSDNAIAIEIEADVRLETSATIDLHVRKGAIGVGLGASLPLKRNFNICRVGSLLSLQLVLHGLLFVQPLVVQSERLVHASIKRLGHLLIACFHKHILRCLIEVARFGGHFGLS